MFNSDINIHNKCKVYYTGFIRHGLKMYHFEISKRTIPAFKLCRKNREYEMRAHERHYEVKFTGGILGIFFKLRVGCVSYNNRGGGSE